MKIFVYLDLFLLRPRSTGEAGLRLLLLAPRLLGWCTSEESMDTALAPLMGAFLLWTLAFFTPPRDL